MRFAAKTFSSAAVVIAVALGLLVANVAHPPSAVMRSCAAAVRSGCVTPGDQFRWDIEWSIVGLVVGMCVCMLVTLARTRSDAAGVLVGRRTELFERR